MNFVNGAVVAEMKKQNRESNQVRNQSWRGRGRAVHAALAGRDGAETAHSACAHMNDANSLRQPGEFLLDWHHLVYRQRVSMASLCSHRSVPATGAVTAKMKDFSWTKQIKANHG